MALIFVSVIISFSFEKLSDKDSLGKEIELKKNIVNLNHRNDSLRDNLNQIRDTLNHKIAQLENDNFNLSSQLSNTSFFLNSNILGQGYAIFEVYGNSRSGEYYSGLESKGRYPLYDISLMVTDFDEAIKCRTEIKGNKFFFDQDCYFKNSMNVKSKNLTPNMVGFVDYSFTTSNKLKNLEIIFTSRGSHVLQQSVYKLQKGICPKSYRIYKIDDKQLVLLESKNDLGLPNSYWEKNFYPVKNRTLGIYNSK